MPPTPTKKEINKQKITTKPPKKAACCKWKGPVSLEFWCFHLKSLVLTCSVADLLSTGTQMGRTGLTSGFCLWGGFRRCWVVLLVSCDGAMAFEEWYYLISRVKLNFVSPVLFRILCGYIEILYVQFWGSAWLAPLSTCRSDCFFLNASLDLAANGERQKNTIPMQFNPSLPDEDKLQCGASRLFWVNSLCRHLTHPEILGQTFSCYKCHGSIENVSCWDPASDCSRRVVWTGGRASAAGLRVQMRHGTIFIKRAVAWRCSLLWAFKLSCVINYSCS